MVGAERYWNLLDKNLIQLPPVIPQGKFCLIENDCMQPKFEAFFSVGCFFFHVSRWFVFVSLVPSMILNLHPFS